MAEHDRQVWRADAESPAAMPTMSQPTSVDDGRRVGMAIVGGVMPGSVVSCLVIQSCVRPSVLIPCRRVMLRVSLLNSAMLGTMVQNRVIRCVVTGSDVPTEVQGSFGGRRLVHWPVLSLPERRRLSQLGNR